jgi:hypothetical protein
MCLWKHKPPIILTNRRLLSFTINDYPGSINDLNGCNNDGSQVKETLLTYWPDFDVKRFIDSEAKVNTFKKEVATAIAVLVMADSCFSETITRLIKIGLLAEEHPTRNRFYHTPGVPIQKIVRTFVSKGNIRWIVMSGCGETQFSADAYINNSYHGAFTWFAMKTLKPGITYREWHKEISKYLPGTEYEQIPGLEGPDELLDRKVFECETLVIHNSTHGTQLAGNGGDEPIDEAICFYDGNLRDDTYYNLLNKIV